MSLTKIIISISIIFLYGFCSKPEKTRDIKKEYYESGKLFMETSIKDDGSTFRVLYFENGRIWRIEQEENGKLYGIIRQFYETGKLESERSYENGIPHGETRTYYESGEINKIINYKDGNPCCQGKSFYESGILLSRTMTKGENCSGKIFYETGEILSEYELKNFTGLIYQKFFEKDGDFLDGEKEIKYNSGRIYIKGNFSKGIPKGKLKTFWETGNIKDVTFYKNGIPEGEETMYFENGKKMMIIPFKKGIIDGKMILYDRFLTTEVSIQYKNGKETEGSRKEEKINKTIMKRIYK